MLRTSILAFLAIAVVGISAVYVGGKEGNGVRPHLRLGANKCTWGPGYWCKNISTSHECGAIQHCVTKQWNSLELPKDQSSACEMCENFLTHLETILKANLTVDVIEGVLDNLCSEAFIPAKVCEKYLNPYIDEIHTAIVNHIKPQVTCHVIHFCNNEEGVSKTFQRLALTQGYVADDKKGTHTLSDAALAAVMPLGPVILNSEVGPAPAQLSCSDGQVYWCKNMENAKECNAVEHCKQVVWAHQPHTPMPEISAPHADSTATPPTSPTPLSPLSYSRLPLSSVECSRGQTFWCGNLTTAASCHAVGHCIQAVWSHMRVTKDGDNVCKICKDMVRQARDQLTSNETQNDLKAVFEGSCNLMPVKVIREGCDRLVDDFVPELVEVLSSQMNPDVVCSVAGLCNNALIDQVLLNSAQTSQSSAVTTSKASTEDNSDCKNCASFADLLTRKFNSASAQDMMNVFRSFCSEFSTFSDVCLKMVDAHGSLWYDNLKVYFASGMVSSRHFPFSVLNMCRTNDMCTNQTIVSSVLHPAVISVEVSHKSETGVLSRDAETKDDLPCSLCDQLVVHLKDILVANTTQAEFKEVLEGICKQTGSFSAECKNLVEQYYGLIYTFLTTELNPNVICVDVGLCPRKPTLVFNNIDILNAMPVPVVPVQIAPVKQLPSHVHTGEELEMTSEEFHKKVSAPVAPQIMIESTTKPACTICEYVLHFVQEQVADSKNEKSILTAMDKACKQMPGEFATECDQFVHEYGPAFIALVIQQIDPSQVCPKLKVCSVGMSKAPMSFAENRQSKGACPLCLMAVQALDDSILNNRTEENIKQHLDKICSSLPKHLASDCDRFINLYYEELIDMLVAETTPQEICVYMRLCKMPKRIVTPEIVVDESASAGSLDKDSQACILCEFIMTNLDKIIEDKKTEEEIKHAVHSVCRVMPKSVKQECDDFVNQYADLIIQLLGQSLSPKQVCQALNACKPNTREVKVSQCAVCEEAMSHLDDALADPEVKNNNIKTALDKVCYHVAQSEFDDCNKFILKYGTKILTIIDSTPSYLICKKIKVCADPSGRLALMEDQKSTAAHHVLEASGKEEQCKSWLGVTLCQSQVLVVLIGILMCGSLIVIFVIARSVRRHRSARCTSLPYEKLYQPTTIPSHAADDFTATIVR